MRDREKYRKVNIIFIPIMCVRDGSTSYKRSARSIITYESKYRSDRSADTIVSKYREVSLFVGAYTRRENKNERERGRDGKEKGGPRKDTKQREGAPAGIAKKTCVERHSRWMKGRRSRSRGTESVGARWSQTRRHRHRRRRRCSRNELA